jgi:hypothetical protein
MQESPFALAIDLAPEAHDLNINHVVEGGEPPALLPNVSLEHFTRNDVPLESQQEFKNVYFTLRQRNLFSSTHSHPCPRIQLQVLTF